ncbi:MAG: hypothetical protein Q8O67_27030 [Deltaproteobacteria bacterium]|nr:hypothetical protein [Deltaproteobacteria bacterium]
MKIVCVDVRGSDDDVAAAAVARGSALAVGADRLLLFGHAALIGARVDQRERDAREGAWLDDAASWLLRDQAPLGEREEKPPVRPVGGPLDKAMAIVPARVEGITLPRSDRVVEMAGTLLVMVVPDGESIDAVDNANLWLVGGGAFSIAQHGPRAVVVVGDRIVVVSILAGEATVHAHAFDGSVSEHSIGLQMSSRMSVRSA